MIRFTVLLTIVGVLVFAGCGQQPGDAPAPPAVEKTSPAEPATNPSEGATMGDVKDGVKDVVKAASAVAGQEREKFAKKVAAWQDRLDEQVKNLDAQGKQLDEKAREEWQAAWAKVQEKQKSLAEKSEALQAASGDAWVQLKEGVDGAAKELKESIDVALAEYDRITAPAKENPEAEAAASGEAKSGEAGSDEK